MKRIDDLEKLLQTEADLAEALIGVMAQKQQSIIRFNGDALGTLTQREQDLVAPFRELEKERIRVSEEIAAGIPMLQQEKPVRAVNLRELASALDRSDAERIDGQTARLRRAVERIVTLNDQNRVLMNNSVKFVRETLRIITHDNTKKLVDKKM